MGILKNKYNVDIKKKNNKNIIELGSYIKVETHTLR